jgi:hypothetical protein
VSVATVESAFVVLDRASGPIRGIRRELRGMQRDAEAAGVALDGVSDPKRAAQLEDLAKSTRHVSTEDDRLRESSRGLEHDLRALEQQETRNTRQSREHRLELGRLGEVLRMLRWPAMIAGAGGATQVLGGLAAGAVELIPKLTDVAGTGAAVGTTMFGAAEAMGVTKLATHGLSQALAGNKKALHDLTPEGRAFVQMIREARPEYRDLQRTAQRGLFPGAGDLLGSLRTEAPALRRIVGQVSGDVGNLASFAGQQIEKPGFMRDLSTLSDQGSRALGSAARSGFYFAHAIEQILIAGGPFTDWLGNTVVGWARTAKEEATVARQTGELGGYFDRVRGTLTLLEDVGVHTWRAIGGLLHAARGDSEGLWVSIDKDARRWDEWSNSFKGQNDMRRWFDDARPTLHAVGVLVGDIATAIAHLSQGPEGARMIQELDQAIPSLAQGVGSITTNFGPAAVSAIGSGVRLLGDLGDQSGPLTLMARAAGLTADAVDRVVRSLGPLGPEIASLATAALVLKKVGLLDLVVSRARGGTGGGTGGGGGSSGLLGGLGLGLASRGAGGAVRGVTAAEGVVLGGGAAVAGGRLARLRAGAGIFGGTARDVYGVQRALGAGRVAAGTEALAGASELTGISGMATAGLSVAGKVLWPLALASGALGALGTQGNLLDKTQGGLSALTLGIVPRPHPVSELEQAGAQSAGQFVNRLDTGGSLRGQRQAIGQLQQRLGTDRRRLAGPTATGLFGNVLGGAFRIGGHAGLSRDEQAQLKAETKGLESELRRREGLLRDSTRRVQQGLDAESVRHGQAAATDWAHSFEIRAKGSDGPIAAMHRTIDGVLNEQRRMRPAGARVLDETMIAWARQQARDNPKLRGQVEKLIAGIEDSFSRMGKHVDVVNGQILTGSTSEWKNIRLALSTQTEKAREETSSDFTAIQQQAIGSLDAMGFSASEARRLVQGLEQGGASGQLSKAVIRAPGATRQRNRVSGIPAQAAGDGTGPSTSMTVNAPRLTVHGSPVSMSRAADHRDQRRLTVNVDARRLSRAGPSVNLEAIRRARLEAGFTIVKPDLHVTFKGDFSENAKQRLTAHVQGALDTEFGQRFDSHLARTLDDAAEAIHTGSEEDEMELVS